MDVLKNTLWKGEYRKHAGAIKFQTTFHKLRKNTTAIPQEGFAWSGKTGWC
jgi:hypothetical protein